MQKKRVWIAVLVLAIAITAVAGWLIYENHLDQAQQDALAELDRNAGQYDTQSIVLHSTSKAQAKELAELYGATLRITKDGRFATLTLPEGTTIRDVYAMEESRVYIDDMAADYQVQVSELTGEEDGERLPSRPQYSVSDTDYELQTYLDYLNLGQVWNTNTGSGITVAVIDTGIDTDHPEFAGRISEYSYNATEDKIVKDFLLEDGSYDWSLIEDEQGHGTAVTGVIAAAMDGSGIVGIAPNVEIIVIKAECDAYGAFERTSDLVFGLYYAIERDVQVVNMSFGGYGPSNPYAEATQLAVDSDIICVAAAGNDSTSSRCWPAADENVIGVGALGEGWNLAFYSNYGENTDLVAPGTTYTTQMGGGYHNSTGTSLASPVVAGAIALLMQNNPYMSFEEVRELLSISSYDLGELGCDWDYGFGALDISALVMEDRGTIHYNMLTDELENMDGRFIQGHTLQQMPEPERLYAIFDGWYYDDTFTQEFQYYEDKLYGEVTLYAKWVNEDDGIPYTYVTLDDGTVEIRSYTGRRHYITIPSMIDGKVVSSIGDFAFEGQTRLREVTLPSGITNIGRYAFSGCSNLTSIQIPAAVTQIKECAFAENIRLRTVAFLGESKLQFIGDYAFAESGLDRVELPAVVTDVNGSAFFGATNLQEIKVQSGNATFQSNDGVLLTKDGTKLVAFPAAWGSGYSLPAGVTTIGRYAFGFASIPTVVLDGVTTIEEGAFANARLEHVTISDSVTHMVSDTFVKCELLSSVKIGTGLTIIPDSAFSRCINLSSIHIPANILSIGDGAFSLSGLQEVSFAAGSRLAAIGISAFAGCGISQIDVPASVMEIGEKAFMNNPLQQVTFGAGSALKAIGAEAFASCWPLQSIALSAGLELIGELAFSETGLTTVTIPATVTELGNGAFSGCADLQAITVAPGNAYYRDIDGVVYSADNLAVHAYPAGKMLSEYTLEATTQIIKPYAFAGTQTLNTVIMPEGLTQIDEYAFFNSKSLNYLHIPDNVVQLGRYAFAESWNLFDINFGENSKLSRLSYGAFAYSGISWFRVPANVSTMGQKVFYGCKNLCSVTFAANSKLESISAYVFDGCDILADVYFEEGSALKSIQAHGLDGLKSLYSINLGNTKLENIDNYAFRFCTNLAELNLPQTVKNIGRYAFYECTNLYNLTLPTAVEHIGSYAFLGTNNLDLYMYSEKLPSYLDENWDHGLKGYYTGVSSVNESGDYKYAVLPSGNIAILQYLGNAPHVDLNQVNLGGSIVTIGGSAFEDSGVTSVVLPNTLTEIQAEAFRNSKLTAISIPASVTFIGREAFAGSAIQQITFAVGSNLAVMEQYAFEDTKNLKTVTLPASLTTMGTGVFLNSGLESVQFSAGIKITEIPQKAFAETKLTSVTMPDSVTLVNHNAFSNVQTLKSVSFGNNAGIRLMSNAFYHTGLESLHIPANVTYIGEYCFVALPNLKTFSVDAANPKYTAVDGLLLSKDGRKLVAVPAGRSGSLTVPLSVEEIGFGAFEESRLSEIKFHENANILSLGYRSFFKAENITTITIPKSVVAIDYYAFAYCENLKEVIFAEDNQLKGIYEGAFCGDIHLESIVLPESIVEISDWAFYACGKIDELPISQGCNLKGIYSYAFAYTGLGGAFTTPETLIDIGDYAFLGNDFTSVTIPDTNQKDLIIGIGAFEECNQITEVTLPFIGASFEDDEITWFGYIFGAGSFYANKIYVPESLSVVHITEGITTVGQGAFMELSMLEKIDVPSSVSMVYDGAFGETTASYELKQTITTYVYGLPAYYANYWTFGHGISGKLSLAEGITEIVLYTCPDLEELEIPEGAEIVRLDYCTALEEINLPDSVTDFSCAYCTDLRQVDLPDGLTRIETNTFTECTSLVSLDIPDTVTSIGENAFAWCKSLTNLTIPEGVTQIEGFTFQGCSSLSSVTLPSTLQSIDMFAFNQCEKLFEIINHSSMELEFGSEEDGWVAYYAKWIIDRSGNKTYLDENAEFVYVDTPDGFRFMREYGEYTLVAYTGTESTITLPENINGKSYEIRNFRNGEHIILPDGMTSIGENAFRNHETLKTISIPDSVTSFGRCAFQNCVNLQSVTMPSNLEGVGNFVFDGCSSLTSITLPDTVKYIFMNAFAGTGLTSIHIPRNVNHITLGAFQGSAMEKITVDSKNKSFTEKDGILYTKDMTQFVYVPEKIESITIPASITDISQVFEYHTNLKTVTFEAGSKLKTIGYCAFMDCKALEEITLPDGLLEIGNSAFSNCISLKNIEIPNTVTHIGDGAFVGCEGLTEITIPSSVTFMEERAFRFCTNLQKIEVEAGNTNYTVLDGIVYDKDLTRIIAVPSCLSGEVTIAPGVTEIPWGTFDHCAKITHITLPDGIKLIGSFAFNECRSLRSIHIPDSVTTIEDGAFQSCQSLSSIVLPKNLTRIEDYTFAGCQELVLVDMPEGITHIGMCAFSDCQRLARITIPSGVTEVGHNAFGGCMYLREVYNDSNLNLQFGSDSHGGVAMYATMIEDNNGNRIYRDGRTDSGLTITDDGFVFVEVDGENLLVTYMGVEDTVTLPLTMNGEPYELYNFRGGKHVIIPQGITHIRYSAFYWNKTIESIVIPDSVTSIDTHAFLGCDNLADITIPDTITYLGMDILGETAYFNNPANWRDGGLYLNNYLLNVDPNVKNFVLPADTALIAEHAFYGCYALKTLETHLYSPYILLNLPNLETLILSGSSAPWMDMPMTLKNVVLTDTFTMSNDELDRMMFNGITFFVDQSKSDTQWDANYPNWNNGNTVVYNEDWVWVSFYDHNGDLIRKAPQRSHAVIRLPYVEVPEGGDEYSYEFTGWDIDGDGEADSIPATSTVDIYAHAVIKKVEKQYSIVFMDKETGTIYHQLKAPKGAFIYTPTAPSKEDATFLGWGKYGKEGTVYVTGDMTIYAGWHYHSYESSVTPPTCEAQGYTIHTCWDCGFQKKDSFIDALSHSFTDYVSDENGTCQADGTKTASCDHGCGKTDTVADPGSKTDHQYGDWYVVKPSTETEEGLKRRDCQHCDHFEEVVTPIWVGPEEVTSDVFEIGEGTVSKIPVGTTVADFLNGINDAEYVKIFKDGMEVASTAAVGTGMEVRLIVDDAVVQTLTVIVTGDTNGDGAITITDMLAIKSHVLKKSNLESAYFTAGDTSDDGAISITDFIQVKAQILGKSDIVPHSAELVAVETVQTVNTEPKENTVISAEIIVVRPVAALLPKPMKKG